MCAQNIRTEVLPLRRQTGGAREAKGVEGETYYAWVFNLSHMNVWLGKQE